MAIIISWSDGDSQENQDEGEDHVSNLALVGFLSSNVFSCVKEKPPRIATKMVHSFS